MLSTHLRIIFFRSQVIHDNFVIIQEEVHNYNGVIKEFSADDKGAVVVCAFGIAPLVGQEHELRATLSSIAIMQKIIELQEETDADTTITMGFGIATGQVFITCFGDSLRREFALVGDVVNSAARTASIASKGGSILLGKSTW